MLFTATSAIAGILTVLIAVIGYFLNKWIKNVDENLVALNKNINDLLASFAAHKTREDILSKEVEDIQNKVNSHDELLHEIRTDVAILKQKT